MQAVARRAAGWLAVALAGCGGAKHVPAADGAARDARTGDGIGSDGTPSRALVGLAVLPCDFLLFLDDGAPASQRFGATASYSDGTTLDVSGTSTFLLDDPSFGAFAGPAYTSTAKVGVAGFHVAYGGLRADDWIVQLARRVDPATGASLDLPFVLPYGGSSMPSSAILDVKAGAAYASVGTTVLGEASDLAGRALPGGHTTADFFAPAGALRGIVPFDSVPAVGASGGPASIDPSTESFVSVQAGDDLRFRVTADDDFVPGDPAPAAPACGEPRAFRATVQIVAGATVLDTRHAYAVVPPG